jgi:hypothetical protein
MKIPCLIFLCLFTGFCYDMSARVALADTPQAIVPAVPVNGRFYIGNGYDFAMLSTAFVEKPGSPVQLTMPRFTALVNIGFNFHYDINRRLGFYTGLGITNIGFIEKIADSTIKRRVYALGIPFAIKLGDLRTRNFVFLGGGIDIPFNYREKGFASRRGDKEKFSEWFSRRTPAVMPFVFLGKSWDPGITLKLQYYPLSFMNEDFRETPDGSTNELKPYAGYNVNLLVLSLGIDIHYGQYGLQEREYQRQKKR